jgi:hypothetical protein
MNKKVKALKDELANCGKMPIFEIEVNDKYCQTDHVLCDVSFQGNSLIASRRNVSSKEERSEFIAESKIVVDCDFSLDENLQTLHDLVLNDINQGDLFTIN